MSVSARLEDSNLTILLSLLHLFSFDQNLYSEAHLLRQLPALFGFEAVLLLSSLSSIQNSPLLHFLAVVAGNMRPLGGSYSLLEAVGLKPAYKIVDSSCCWGQHSRSCLEVLDVHKVDLAQRIDWSGARSAYINLDFGGCVVLYSVLWSLKFCWVFSWLMTNKLPFTSFSLYYIL